MGGLGHEWSKSLAPSGNNCGLRKLTREFQRLFWREEGEAKVCGGGKKFARWDGELVLDGAPRSRKAFNNICRIFNTTICPKRYRTAGHILSVLYFLSISIWRICSHVEEPWNCPRGCAPTEQAGVVVICKLCSLSREEANIFPSGVKHHPPFQATNLRTPKKPPPPLKLLGEKACAPHFEKSTKHV